MTRLTIYPAPKNVAYKVKKCARIVFTSESSCYRIDHLRASRRALKKKSEKRSFFVLPIAEATDKMDTLHLFPM